MSQGTVCTPEEYALSIPSADNPYPLIYCLSRGQSIGLALTAESGFISAASVLILFGLIIRNIFRYRKLFPDGGWRLLQGPTDIYMLSLFLMDLIQAAGTILDVKWVNVGKVYSGTFCSVQGIVQQFGETGVAMSTTAITVHTFLSVFWRIGARSRLAAFFFVFIIWAFVGAFTGVNAGLHHRGSEVYDTPTPYWCWVGERYGTERIAGEYLWLWIALFSSVIMYIPLYFWSQGYLSLAEGSWWRFRVHRPTKRPSTRAIGMLAYPAVYSLLVLPLSVVRWITFRTQLSVPSAATFCVVFLFSLSGACNVLLLLLTRPQLLLFGTPRLPAPPPPPPMSARSLTFKSVEDGDSQGWSYPGVRASDSEYGGGYGKESTEM